MRHTKKYDQIGPDIDSGLHQRLDVSHNDDRCRVRNDNAMLVLGIMLCLSNSLFVQWRGYQRRPDLSSLTHPGARAQHGMSQGSVTASESRIQTVQG